jgi:hypothetical protein
VQAQLVEHDRELHRLLMPLLLLLLPLLQELLRHLS